MREDQAWEMTQTQGLVAIIKICNRELKGPGLGAPHSQVASSCFESGVFRGPKLVNIQDWW